MSESPWLMRGDCLEEMARIPGSSVDAVIADLPYGTTACKWDSAIPLAPLWDAYARILRPNGSVVLFCSEPFTSVLTASNLRWYRDALVWRKNKPTGHLSAKRRHMRQHEDIRVFSPGTPCYNPQMQETGRPIKRARQSIVQGDVYRRTRSRIETPAGRTTRYPTTILDFPVVDNISRTRIHPSQKPVALLEYLVTTYTNEGDTVLDNTMGSGTAGVACVNTGRRFIGIELSPDYFAKGKQRIEEAMANAAMKLAL